jgi:Rrf2 family iron-sulfur cluster assembly transcriptional regulator
MPLLPYKTILMIGAVVDIAMYSVEEPVRGPDLADRLHLPRRYLEPVLQTLVRKGILVGVRGARGGYKLAKAPGAISVYDISEAVKTIETEEPSGLLWAVVVPALTQAEQCFASALKRITVEELTHSASTQMDADRGARRDGRETGRLSFSGQSRARPHQASPLRDPPPPHRVRS